MYIFKEHKEQEIFGNFENIFSSNFKPILAGFFGVLVAYALMTTICLSDKYAMTFALGLIVAPLVFVFKDKEKLLMGAFILSLPVSMGIKIIERFESTNSVVKFLLQVYLNDIFLILLFFIFFFKVVMGRHSVKYSIWKSKLAIPLLLWICMGFVSLIPAIDRIVVLVEVIRLGRVFLTFFIVFHYIKERKDIHFILKCLLIAVFFQSLLMFAQFVTNSLIVQFPGNTAGLDIIDLGQRSSGTMGHSTNFAKFSGLILPISLAYVFFFHKLRNKLFMLLIWVCGSIALILTLSRIGLMTWLLSMIFFFAGIIILRIIPIRLTFPMLIKGIILICIGVGILYLAGGDRLQKRINYDSGSAAVRIPMFKVAFNVIKAHPLIGVGLKNYILIHQEYDNTPEHISGLLPDSPVHNLFLLYASEIGMLGLLFFLWFIWKILKDSVLCAKYIDKKLDKAIYLCIAIGLMSILIQSMTCMGVTNHFIHLSSIAILGACVVKQRLILSNYPDKYYKPSYLRH